MTIETFQQCRSLEGWRPVRIHSSTRDRVYTVFVNPWDSPESNICECEGYMFGGKCRHQREAAEYVCGWHEIDGVAQTAGQKQIQQCPECGGPTMLTLENVDR